MLSPSHNSRVLDVFPWLSVVSSEEWVKAQPAVRKYAANSRIFQREEAASYGMFLLSGTARISRIAEDGGESVMSILHAGEVCALFVLSGLSSRDYPGTITAESEVEALFVAKESFLGWLHRYAEIRSAVFGGLLDGLLRISEQVDGHRAEALDTRLTRALLRMPSEQGLLLNLTHHGLAVEIGSSREVVSRALRRYRQQGWIETGRGWIRIIRRDALESRLGD
ncbi:Crp/Fnr family transcriptional regulator [Paenibacillus aurantiacus]|uniref:Crp/Fnr family transcriptional regulator n=1 Tax=Paenibacillus aurantiacus TaxID=1936118 RepID=A0ABV5L0X2_9BACL